MNTIIKKMNREILEFIRHMDVDPGRERPVTVWFYSDDEERIYLIASRLKESGYRIECCEYCDDSRDYLCIAEKQLTTSAATIDKLCTDMQQLAARLGVTFDGWETRIDPG